MTELLREIKTEYIIHSMAWVFILTFLLYIGDQSIGLLFSVGLLIANFYLFYGYLIPKVLRRRWWLFLILFMACATVFVVLLGLVNPELYNGKISLKVILGDYFKRTTLPALFLYSFYTVIIIVLRLSVDWFRDGKIKMELQNQHLSSELAFLRSQVNPHFLFNTLNNIYALAYKKSDDAPAAIMKLSSMMRYMLYEANGEKVLLSKELDHLNHYIELQQLRRKGTEWLDLQIEGETQDKLISPLLLIPLVENAFKHGSLKSKIRIHLTIREKELLCYVTNVFSPNETKDSVGGVGLENIRRRLQLLYPGIHQMEIEKSEKDFAVKLQIRL